MKTTILAMALAVAAMSAQAEVRNYDCELHSMEAQGWIPPRVLLSVDAENKRARAYDGHIRESNDLSGQAEETPVNAKFKTTRKGEYRMNWRITLSSNTARKFRVDYTATLDPKTNKLGMRVRFPMDSLTNRPSGEGMCKPVKSPSLF